MASLTRNSDNLKLTFDTADKVLGLVGDLTIPLEAITSITVTDDPFAAVKGLRAPGLALPGRIRIGTWRSPGSKLLVAARNRQTSIVLTLQGQTHSRVVVGTDNATSLAEELAAAPNVKHIETEFTVASGGEVLSGTYTRPAGTVLAQTLLIPGSGEVNRDADHRRIPLGVSRDLAHVLAAKGIASARYDKRGVGRSTGSFLRASLADNQADAAAVLEWLRQSAPAAGLPVFLAGHSEGAIITELLAADDDQLAGVVLLAAPGTPGEEMMKWQAREVSQTLPKFSAAIIKVLRIDLMKQQQKAIAKLRSNTSTTMRMQGKTINAQWQRELLDFNPPTVLPRITAPVLAITGGKDLQVNPDDLTIIRDLVGGPVEIQRPADLTHLLRNDAGPASFAAYRKLFRQKTDEGVLNTVGEWISARATAKV